MAKPATLPGPQLLIKIGDGASPETFAHPCSINAEREFAIRAQANDIVVPDCSDPDAPAYRELVKDVISSGVSGGGKMDNTVQNIQMLTAWAKNDTAKNCRVYVGTVGYWPVAMKCTEVRWQGARGDKINFNITLESDGVVGDFTAA
jgi:hypothetical protein